MKGSLKIVTDLDKTGESVKEAGGNVLGNYSFRDINFYTSIGDMRIRTYEGEGIGNKTVVQCMSGKERGQVLFWKECGSIQEGYIYMNDLFPHVGNAGPKYKETEITNGKGIECELNGAKAYFETKEFSTIQKRRTPLRKIGVDGLVDRIVRRDPGTEIGLAELKSKN